MGDKYGAFETPVQEPGFSAAGRGVPVNRVIDCIGSFLSAILIARVGPMWEAVAPSLSPIVKRVFTASPEDVLLNESHLPALFVWRGQPGMMSQLADDWWITESPITVLWLLEPGEITQREIRLRAQAPIAQAIHSALSIGRDPAWVDEGDTDPTAAKRGSVLTKRAGLTKLPMVQRSEPLPIVITRDTAEPVNYRAVSTQVLVTERYRRDPSAHGTPAAASISVQSGGTSVDSKFDP